MKAETSISKTENFIKILQIFSENILTSYRT